MSRKILALFLAFLTFFFASVPSFATDISATSPVSINGTIAADAADVTLTATSAGADTTNLTGREMLLVQNSHGSNAYTITISSVADDLGRTGDITAYSLAAGEFALFGPFPIRGWRQTTGKLNFASNNAAIKVMVIRIPNTI